MVAPPEGRYRLLHGYLKGAVDDLPPRLADGPQELRPVEEPDVFEARGQRFARRLNNNILPTSRQFNDASDRLGRLAPGKFAAVAAMKGVRLE